MIAHLFCYLSTGFSVCLLSRACNKVITSLFILYCKWIIFLNFLYVGFILPRVLIDLSLLHLLLCISDLETLISHSLASLRVLDHFWVLQRNYMTILPFLCLIDTLHVPQLGMLELLYLHNLFIYLLVLFCNCDVVNSILNILIGIRLLSLPVSNF